MIRPIALATFSLALAAATPATAHPHVWVTGEADFRFEADQLTRLGLRWQFDPFFSQVLAGDFDTNADGIFDAEETEAMKDQVFTSLKDFGYFTHLAAAGEDVAFAAVDNFSVSDNDGELVFSFDLVLAEPITAGDAGVTLSLYDPTIYVDLILDGSEPVHISGADDLGCTIEFRQGPDVESQSFFIAPQEVLLRCSG